MVPVTNVFVMVVLVVDCVHIELSKCVCVINLILNFNGILMCGNFKP